MPYRRARFVGCGLVVAWCVSACYPALGFDEGNLGVLRAGTNFDFDNFPTSRVTSDLPPGTPPQHERSLVISANPTPAHGRAPDGHVLRPPLREKTAIESPALLCAQYSVALLQCFIALQGLKSEPEPEPLSMFEACLRGRNFPTEPNVCRRTLAAPIESGKDDPEGT
jgi:hypothetical protein